MKNNMTILLWNQQIYIYISYDIYSFKIKYTTRQSIIDKITTVFVNL